MLVYGPPITEPITGALPFWVLTDSGLASVRPRPATGAGGERVATTGNDPAMDGYEFRRRGREMVDYIVDYLDNIDTRRVTPNIEPGYLRDLIPREPPQDPDDWDDIMEDVEKKIMIGVTHWQHPRFHAYFPAGNSYPSILGDMLGDAIGCVGFSWAAAPACTELETIMLDWMGRIVGLPSHFLTYAEGSRCVLSTYAQYDSK